MASILHCPFHSVYSLFAVLNIITSRCQIPPEHLIPRCRTWLRSPPRPITATVHHSTEDIALKETSEFDWSREHKAAASDSFFIYSCRLIIPDKCLFNKPAPVGLNTLCALCEKRTESCTKRQALHLPISNSTVFVIWCWAPPHPHLK